MDVTQNIVNNFNKYGATPSINPDYLATSKTLDFAQGASITKPLVENVTVLPLTIRYRDSVGLFGAENQFIKLEANIQNTNPRDTRSRTTSFFESAVVTDNDPAIQNTYKKVIVTGFDNTGDVHYAIATVNESLSPLSDPLVSVDLVNLKTGNRFVDDHFDVEIYTSDRVPHQQDRIYIKPNDHCYICFHARKPRRLPYDVQVTVGQVYEERFLLSEEEKEFLPRKS